MSKNRQFYNVAVVGVFAAFLCCTNLACSFSSEVQQARESNAIPVNVASVGPPYSPERLLFNDRDLAYTKDVTGLGWPFVRREYEQGISPLDGFNVKWKDRDNSFQASFEVTMPNSMVLPRYNIYIMTKEAVEVARGKDVRFANARIIDHDPYLVLKELMVNRKPIENDISVFEKFGKGMREE